MSIARRTRANTAPLGPSCSTRQHGASKRTEVVGCFAFMRRPVIYLTCNLLHPSLQPRGFSAPYRTPSHHPYDHAPEPLTIVDSLYWARQRHLGVWRQRGDHRELGRQEYQRPLRRQAAAEPALTSSLACQPRVARPMCPPNPHITSHQEAYQSMHPLQASTTVPSSCQATGCRSVVEILP